jgi:dTDP-4-amino-4,6-dideoxygalactose transaminase
VVSRDEAFTEKVKLLRNHGSSPKYYHPMVGGNFRLDPIQAAILRIKLKNLETWHHQRRENAERYNRLFSASDIGAEGVVTTPKTVYLETAGGAAAGRNCHIYNQYVIRAERRDVLRDWLEDRGIATEIYYPLGLHQQKCLEGITSSAPMKHTEQAARETLALPIYPGLTSEMQEYVVKSIADFYR